MKSPSTLSQVSCDPLGHIIARCSPDSKASIAGWRSSQSMFTRQVSAASSSVMLVAACSCSAQIAAVASAASVVHSSCSTRLQSWRAPTASVVSSNGWAKSEPRSLFQLR